MSEKTKEQRLATKAGAIDELSLENAVRNTYKGNWPNTIVQLTKRIQAVNQTWNKVMWQIMNIPGLSINYHRDGNNLIITVTHTDGGDEVETHKISIEDLGTASQYIEVLIMDKLDHSELIARVDPQQEKVQITRTIEEAEKELP